MSMGGRAEGLACADPGARTPIGASRNYPILHFLQPYLSVKSSEFSLQPALLTCSNRVPGPIANGGEDRADKMKRVPKIPLLRI